VSNDRSGQDVKQIVLRSRTFTSRITRTETSEASVCACVRVCLCDSLGSSVVAPTSASVKNCRIVVGVAEMDGSSGRRVVLCDDDRVSAAGCVELMTSALLPENRVIGALLTELPRFVGGLIVAALSLLFPAVVGTRSVNAGVVVIVFQLEVA